MRRLSRLHRDTVQLKNPSGESVPVQPEKMVKKKKTKQGFRDTVPDRKRVKLYPCQRAEVRIKPRSWCIAGVQKCIFL